MVLCMFCWVLKVYILYRVVRTVVALLWAILIYLIAPIFYQPNFDRYKGRWTVVSGGTDGIGKAYLFELARRGLRRFVIIGRNQQKIDSVKAKLENDYNANVRTYLFDFSTDDFENLREYITNIDIGFVVNSVGVGRELMERYGDNPAADRSILKVNGLGSAEFLSMVLPVMEKNGGGQIVVLSSSQGYRPIPYLGAYCASKAMMTFLSEAIDREWKTIRVQCLTPALVATNMTQYSKGSLFVKTPEAFAYEAVNTIGLVTKTTGCFNHEFQLLLRHMFPWILLKYLSMPIYYYHQNRVLNIRDQKCSHVKSS